jgi:hypothetical protein
MTTEGLTDEHKARVNKLNRDIDGIEHAHREVFLELKVMTEARNREAGQALEMAMENKRLRRELKTARWALFIWVIVAALLVAIGGLT